MDRRTARSGFLEKMLGPLGVDGRMGNIRWVGDPVRTHLNLLLNARQGSVPTLPDYGLPDVGSFYSEYPASLSELRAFVERLIKKYEPRLLNARVRLVESDAAEFRVAFLITGEIEEGEAVTKVQYKTTISASGHAALESSEPE